MPELANVISATHSAVESTKFAMLVQDWKITHLHVAQRVILDILRPSSILLLHRNILYLSIQKRVQIEQ